jgi:transposase
MSLPLHKRYEIVFLAKNKYGPQFGSSKIAKIVKCNRKTVTHWLNRWEETKHLSDRPRCGAPRITTVEQD